MNHDTSAPITFPRLASGLRALAAGLCACLLLAGFTSADVIETIDGSRISGKITSIEDGVITIETPFAGTLSVKQESVTAFTTEEPLYLRLPDGQTFLGTVSREDDRLAVETEAGRVTTSVSQVESSWRIGEESPARRLLREEAEALRRRWAFEASVDIAGRTGNTESFSSALGLRATLAGETDRLLFYSRIDFSEREGERTSETVVGGMDYSSEFVEDWSWYVRSELGRDRIKGIDLWATAAGGIGRDFIDTRERRLTGRAGLSYRYESLDNRENVSSPGLDFSLEHVARLNFGRLRNFIGYVPVFEDFGNYRIFHESSLELPLASGEFWRLRFGVSNDYNSKPPPGTKKLDTTYFTRLILTWN